MTNKTLTLRLAPDVHEAFAALATAKVYGCLQDIRHAEQHYANALRREEMRKRYRQRLQEKECQRNRERFQAWQNARFRQTQIYLADEPPMPSWSSTVGFRRLLSEFQRLRASNKCDDGWGPMTKERNGHRSPRNHGRKRRSFRDH